MNLIYAYMPTVSVIRGKGISYLTTDEAHQCKKQTEDPSIIQRVLAFTEPSGNVNTNEAYTDMRMILDGVTVMAPMIDIDNPDNLDKSYDDTNRVSMAMSKHGMIYGKHYLIDFSGNKGFHIKMAPQPVMEHYHKREVARRLTDLLATIGISDLKLDDSIYSDGRPMRLAGTLNAKSGKYCFTIPSVNDDGQIEWTMAKILDVASNKSIVDSLTSAPKLEIPMVAYALWTKPISVGVKSKVPTASSPAPVKRPKKIKHCELINTMLSLPEKMREHWKNGAGNYFNDLMQVLPMANGIDSVAQLQERIESILEPVRTDLHKEHASYYASKEPNCVGLQSVCNAMGVPCDTCGACKSRLPQIPGLEIARDAQNRPAIIKNITNTVILIQHEYPNMLTRDIVKGRNRFGTRNLTDGDRLEIYARLNQVYRGFPKDLVNDGIDLVLSRNEFDPMLNIVNSVTHDGTNRLDNILRDLCGAEDNAYNRAVSRYLGIAMVSRVLNPGAKADIVPILYSPVQGSGKSSFCEKLAINATDYHTVLGSMSNFGDQKVIERIIGAWVVEFSEMTAMQKSASEEDLKGFVTNRFDKYRPAYAREVKEVGRRCVFVGTTNKNVILKDETGARRWWIVRVSDDCPHKHMPDDEVKAYILQFFAEAKLAVESGEIPDIRSEEVIAVHKDVVEESTDIDEWEGLIREWIQVGGVTHTCALEVWNRVVNQCGAMEKPKQMSKIDSIRIGKIFHRLGWEKRSIRMPGYGKQRCFVTPEHAETVDNIVSLVGSAEVEVIEEQVRPTESTFHAAFGI